MAKKKSTSPDEFVSDKELAQRHRRFNQMMKSIQGLVPDYFKLEPTDTAGVQAFLSGLNVMIAECAGWIQTGDFSKTFYKFIHMQNEDREIH